MEEDLIEKVVREHDETVAIFKKAGMNTVSVGWTINGKEETLISYDEENGVKFVEGLEFNESEVTILATMLRITTDKLLTLMEETDAQNGANKGE